MKKAYGEPKRIISRRRELIEKIDGIATEYYESGMKITVRQVYYQLVARNIMPNSKDSYEKISGLVADGRMAGLIDWNVIEDRTRYMRENAHWENPQQIINAAAEQYRIDTRATQPNYLEAWIEKDSLSQFLKILAQVLMCLVFHAEDFQVSQHCTKRRIDSGTKTTQ